jgi:hypothetical protein
VTAISRSAVGDGALAQCSVSADDGTTRLTGTSNDNALDIAAAPSQTVIFNQMMKLAQSGSDIAERCTFKQEKSINGAVVTGLTVSANGVEQLNLPGPISLSAPPPSVGFGTLYVQNDATATLLKHVAGRSEQLQKGDQVLCKGAFEAPSGSRVFDVNISSPPPGNGTKMDTASSQWTCDPSQFGSGDGCDCSCGITDPDCAAGDCQPQVCSDVAAAWCAARGWTIPVGGMVPGSGRLYCTNNVSANSDCNTCADYNMLVWSNGATPLFCTAFTYSTVAGAIYGGHSPCQCGDNLQYCGSWDMKGCTPD